MPLHYPSHMDEHDKDMIDFINVFNKASPPTLYIEINPEQYMTDCILHTPWGDFGIDWETRKRHYTKKKFPFKELWQVERKFESKKGINITIQMNKIRSHIVCAFHKDFSTETKRIDRKTEFGIEKEGGYRTTKQFKEYSIKDLRSFKLWLCMKCLHLGKQ